MASEKNKEEHGTNDLKAESHVVATKANDTLKKAEEELESLKKTIAALDSIGARWKVSS